MVPLLNVVICESRRPAFQPEVAPELNWLCTLSNNLN